MGTSPDSIRVVGEADLLELAHCARSTLQHWCKKGLLDETSTGLYGEAEVVEVLLAGMLVSALDLRRATALWRRRRAEILAACIALSLDKREGLDVVIDLYSWDATLAESPASLYDLTHNVGPFPLGFVVLPLAPSVRETRRAFWMRSLPPGELAKDRRRRQDRRARPQGGQNPAPSS